MKRFILFTFSLFCYCFSANAQEITIATFNAEFLNKSRVHIKFGKQFDISRESKKEQRFWEDEENRTTKLKEASANVAQLIKQKYGIDQEQWTGAIYDGNKHQIELKNDIVPYIVYKSGDETIKESIRFQLDQANEKKQKYYDKRSDLLLEMI